MTKYPDNDSVYIPSWSDAVAQFVGNEVAIELNRKAMNLWAEGTNPNPEISLSVETIRQLIQAAEQQEKADEPFIR